MLGLRICVLDLRPKIYGFIDLGYASFEHQEFNDEKQALEFAKKIGAEVVLIQSKFERNKKVYSNSNNLYQVSALPAVQNSETSLNNSYAFPNSNYNFSVDLETGNVKEKTAVN